MSVEEHNSEGSVNSNVENWSLDTNDYHVNWSAKDRAIIDENISYHETCYYLLKDLKSNYCRSFKLPTTPKFKIGDLMRNEKKTSAKLEGIDLHTYLTSKLVMESQIVDSDLHFPDLSILENNISIEEMKQHLITGFKFVQKEECKLFRLYLDFGEWLDNAFKVFQNSSINIKWSEWLKINVNINDRYARELRSLSIQFKSFKKFRNLSITLSEILSRKTEIIKMLNTYRSFWENEY